MRGKPASRFFTRLQPLLLPHCAVNRAATNSSQDPPVLGCCQQPTNSPASGASRRRGPNWRCERRFEPMFRRAARARRTYYVAGRQGPAAGQPRADADEDHGALSGLGGRQKGRATRHQGGGARAGRQEAQLIYAGLAHLCGLPYERPVLHHRSSALPTDGRRGRDTATRRDVRATHVPEQALRTGHSTRTVALVG